MSTGIWCEIGKTITTYKPDQGKTPMIFTVMGFERKYTENLVYTCKRRTHTCVFILMTQDSVRIQVEIIQGNKRFLKIVKVRVVITDSKGQEV